MALVQCTSPYCDLCVNLKLLASILWKLYPGQKFKVKIYKGNNSKNKWNKVIVLVLCTCP